MVGVAALWRVGALAVFGDACPKFDWLGVKFLMM